MRFHAHGIARGGIEHPRRHCEKHAITQLDNVAVFDASAKSPHDVTFMVEKWMMPVADSYRR
jgi:hypothetical protein